MNVSEVKLVNFENMVIQDAEQKRDAVLKELSEEKQAKLAIIEEEISEMAKQKLKRLSAKISKEKNERIVQKQLICKQEILNERQKLINATFDGAIKRLNEFINSQEYEKYLIDTVVASKQKLEGASVALISQNDEKYSDKIASLGLSVEYTDELILGGCILIDKQNGMRIDETLSTKLETVRNEFLETYNLKI